VKINNSNSNSSSNNNSSNNNNNNNNNTFINNNNNNNKRHSACPRITKINTIIRNVHIAAGIFGKQERREVDDLPSLFVIV
jgi:hypothetical protein